MHTLKPNELKKGDIIRTNMRDYVIKSKRNWLADAGFSAAYIRLDDCNKSRLWDEIPPKAICLLYTSPSPRDRTRSRMPSSA